MQTSVQCNIELFNCKDYQLDSLIFLLFLVDGILYLVDSNSHYQKRFVIQSDLTLWHS